MRSELAADPVRQLDHAVGSMCEVGVVRIKCVVAVVALTMLPQTSWAFGIGFGQGLAEGLERNHRLDLCESICRRGSSQACSMCFADIDRYDGAMAQRRMLEQHRSEQAERDREMIRKLDEIQRCQKFNLCN